MFDIFPSEISANNLWSKYFMILGSKIYYKLTQKHLFINLEKLWSQAAIPKGKKEKQPLFEKQQQTTEIILSCKASQLYLSKSALSCSFLLLVFQDNRKTFSFLLDIKATMSWFVFSIQILRCNRESRFTFPHCCTLLFL